MNAYAFAPAPAPTPKTTSRRRVLLIDDSSTTHMWVRMVVGRTDYDLLSAHNGDEGVRMAVAERPDLILMDAIMPGMNGFDTTRAIRAIPALRDVPVLMLTTRSAPQNVAAAAESGCTDFVVKPIDGPALVAKLNSFLRN